MIGEDQTSVFDLEQPLARTMVLVEGVLEVRSMVPSPRLTIAVTVVVSWDADSSAIVVMLRRLN
jgi:hypothetical protein